MKLLPEFPGVDGSWQELTGDSREGSRQEMAGKGLGRRYLEMVLELLGSNTWTPHAFLLCIQSLPTRGSCSAQIFCELCPKKNSGSPDAI